MMYAMKATTLVAVGMTMTAAATGLAAPANATTVYQFLSPDGNIGCSMNQEDDGDGYVACDIRDYIFSQVPCPSGLEGNRLVLNQGEPARVECHSGTMVDPGLPVLSYEQPRNVGLIDCVVLRGDSVQCTDRATDHYFSIASDSYTAG
jgi:hypothetical protein